MGPRWIERDTFGLAYGTTEVAEDVKLSEREEVEAKALQSMAVALMEQVFEVDGELADPVAMQVMRNMTPADLSMWCIRCLRSLPPSLRLSCLIHCLLSTSHRPPRPPSLSPARPPSLLPSFF